MKSGGGSGCETLRSRNIFGPDWTEQDVQFQASDDRVRGGTSQSYLEIRSSVWTGEYALFYGTLDTKTLGGAGFASQRTADTTKVWDCSDTDGLILEISKGDGKQYTLTVSNEIGEKRLDGRDKSTILYEYSFVTYSGVGATFKIEWNDFKPMYRGRPKEDAPKLDISKIRRWSFMIRSFFDTQHGAFSMEIRNLCLYRLPLGNEKEKEKKAGQIMQDIESTPRCCTVQ